MNSIEWLQEELGKRYTMNYNSIREIFEEAKEMHRKERVELLMDIDLDLALIEDYAHGEVGNDITKLRIKIGELLKLK